MRVVLFELQVSFISKLGLGLVPHTIPLKIIQTIHLSTSIKVFVHDTMY